MRKQFGIYSRSLGAQVKQLIFSSVTWGLGWGVGGQREDNVCDKSVNEPPLQNKQGGLGRWTWKTRCARAAGLPLVSRETGSKEGRKRQRWCLQHELEPPVAPEE